MTEFKRQIQQQCGSIADVDQKANDFKTKVLASASKKLTWSAKDVEDFYTDFTTCTSEQLTKLKERAFHDAFKYSVERLKAVICELHELCKTLEGDIEKREKKMSKESAKQGTAFAEKLGKQQAYDNWQGILAELNGKTAADLPDDFDDVNHEAQYREALKTFQDHHEGAIATIVSAKKHAKTEEELGVMNEVLAMLKVVYNPRALNVTKYRTSVFATRETFPFLRKLVLYSISIGEAAEARPAKPGSAKAKPQSGAVRVPSKEEVMDSSDLSYERLKLFMDNAALGPPDALEEEEKTTIKQKMLAAIQTKLNEQTDLDKTLQMAIPGTLKNKRPYTTLAQKGVLDHSRLLTCTRPTCLRMRMILRISCRRNNGTSWCCFFKVADQPLQKRQKMQKMQKVHGTRKTTTRQTQSAKCTNTSNLNAGTSNLERRPIRRPSTCSVWIASKLCGGTNVAMSFLKT